MDEYQKNLRDVSEKIEKAVYSKKSKDIKNAGLILSVVSLLLFMFSADKTGKIFSLPEHAIIVDRLPSAIAFLLLHVFTILVLLIPRMPDKFQFATLFTLINIPLLFRVNILICNNSLNLSIFCFFFLMACWILFGLEATRQEAKLAFFRSFGKLNAWIQKKYDEGKF